MPTGLAPRGMNPFNSLREARERAPKRYPAIGFAIIGLYFAGTTIASVIRFGMELHEPVDHLTPPTPAAFDSPSTFILGNESEDGRR